jgi:hypothetical protein
VTRLDGLRQAIARLRAGFRHTALALGAGARRLLAGSRGLVRGLGRGLWRGTRRVWVGAREFWRSVRPTTRRGGALGILGIVAGAAVLAVGLFGGATMAWSPYLESVIYPDVNPAAWAALKPAYAGTGTCGECHQPEAMKASIARHAGIGCESCHGALLEHSLIDPRTPTSEVELEVPTDEICIRCHAGTAGRPDDLRQIVVSDHFVEFCLQCHDPHTGISQRPPVLLHTEVNLPPCATCHGPEGFKARNQRHPEVLDDEPCLACHAPGRGPGGD